MHYMADRPQSDLVSKRCDSVGVWIAPLLRIDFYVPKLEEGNDGRKRSPLRPLLYEKFSPSTSEQLRGNADRLKGYRAESIQLDCVSAPGTCNATSDLRPTGHYVYKDW